MATVTVVTAERTLEIEATSIVDGEINAAGHLILTRHDGTPIDMGAVSGMQMHNGTAYNKVDAFSYIGDADPGAVANGSVWYDTNDVAGPYASDTQKGLVELATNAETLTGTDATRAVTPASLASIPGAKVIELTSGSVAESATYSAYPDGISTMYLTTGSGWSLNSGFGTVVTVNLDGDRCHQTFYARAGSVTGYPKMWTRSYHTADGGGGWTNWHQVMIMINLDPAGFTQATTRGNYPVGMSRLYYTTANGSGWDFSGTAGEVVTFIEDSAFFGRQVFTSHVGGSSKPIQWFRTANQAGGWTAWQPLITDPGAWTPYTPSWSSQGSVQPSLGNATINCKSHKVGRKVEVTFEITFGSTTNFGTSPTTGDNWQFSLPYPAANSTDSIGFLELRQSNDKSCMGKAKLYSTTGFRISIIAGYVDGTAITNSGDVDSLSPFTWASSNSLKGSLTYESAS